MDIAETRRNKPDTLSNAYYLISKFVFSQVIRPAQIHETLAKPVNQCLNG